VPTNSTRVKKTLKSIYEVIDKNKEIILIKHKTHVKNVGHKFKNVLLKDLKKNKVKIVNYNKYPFQMLPAEVIIKLYKVKKTVSYESSAIFFLIFYSKI
jgi:3-phosphoglycerate kinase